jgi:hypothetical protein
MICLGTISENQVYDIDWTDDSKYIQLYSSGIGDSADDTEGRYSVMYILYHKRR